MIRQIATPVRERTRHGDDHEAVKHLVFASPEDPFAPKRTLTRTPTRPVNLALRAASTLPERADAQVQTRYRLASARKLRSRTPQETKSWSFGGFCRFVLRATILQGLCLPWLKGELSLEGAEKSSPCSDLLAEVEELRAELQRCKSQGCSPDSFQAESEGASTSNATDTIEAELFTSDGFCSMIQLLMLGAWSSAWRLN